MCLLVSTSILACPGVAWGQSAQPPAAPPAEADAPRQGVEQIIVTAQRREQRLQDVPIAVSVLSARTLAASGIGSTDALLAVTPGLVATRQLKGSTPYIRGLGTQSTAPGVESPVAQYVDGVYYTSPAGNIFSFNNIERVEVLKGPQGTLFGRNTTGGLIHVVTRDPSADPAVEGSFNYGNYDTVEAALYATGGSDTLAADIAGYFINNKGFGRNLTVGGRVNELDETAVRSKILFRPGANTRMTLSGDYLRNNSDIGATRNIVAGSLGLGATPMRGTVYDTQSGFLPETRTEYWGVSLKAEQEAGNFRLQSITAYRDIDSLNHFDQDAVPTNAANVTARETVSTFQQEVLAVGEFGQLDLTAGLFYFHANAKYDPLGVQSAAPGSNTATFPTQILDSYAAFADGTFALTDTTNLTAGVRYTLDDRHFEAVTLATAGNPRPVGTVLVSQPRVNATFKKFTYRLVLDQKVAPDVMVYASFNTGFKAGVFNPSVITQAVLLPENVRAFEAGLKSEFLDSTLRLNLSAFHNIVTGIQLTRQTLGAQTIFNAARGRINGLEAEAILAPRLANGRLQIGATLSILDAIYTSFPLGPVTVPNAAGGNATVIRDLSGNRMIRSPKWTGSINVDYSIDVGAGEFGVSGNYYHNDGFFWEPDNRLRQEAFDLLNAQAFYAFGDERQFRVRVFGKNLTGQRYFSNVSAGGLGDLAAAAAPRTYGAGFDFRF